MSLSASVRVFLGLVAMLVISAAANCQEPPVVDPFGPRAQVREDAVPGYLELSDGMVHPGSLYLTRDARLRIYDGKLKRHRDVPLQSVSRIEGIVHKAGKG